MDRLSVIVLVASVLFVAYVLWRDLRMPKGPFTTEELIALAMKRGRLEVGPPLVSTILLMFLLYQYKGHGGSPDWLMPAWAVLFVGWYYFQRWYFKRHPLTHSSSPSTTSTE